MVHEYCNNDNNQEHSHRFISGQYSHTGYWSYPYTDQLLALEDCKRHLQPHLPSEWCQIDTPFHPDFWRRELVTHSDSRFATWACDDIEQGFHIGFSSNSALLKETCCQPWNTPQVVTEYIGRPTSALSGRPVSDNNHLAIHTNPLG